MTRPWRENGSWRSTGYGTRRCPTATPNSHFNAKPVSTRENKTSLLALLGPGDTVLVQVVKDALGHKGARLTNQISLAGRYLVLAPNSDVRGISRRLPDDERRRLRSVIGEVRPKGMGVIVRTAAEGASKEDIQADIKRLLRIWENIESQDVVKAPALLHEEPPLVLRVPDHDADVVPAPLDALRLLAVERLAHLPAEVGVDISGASDQLDATKATLAANYPVALIIVFLLLVAIFRHWGYPLLIMTTIPLGIAGGIVGLVLMNAVGAALPAIGVEGFHQPFDMISMLGFLILMGTVVNNPILIVDRAIQRLQETQCSPIEAVRDAVASRLRPIAMSTLTTICGLSPLVFIPGAGTELYRGLGAIVLFGLLFSTLVMLTFMPAMLSLLLLGFAFAILLAMFAVHHRWGRR